MPGDRRDDDHREYGRLAGHAFDVVIVGSGVAGSLLADRLTADGLEVLILEAGPYVAEKVGIP